MRIKQKEQFLLFKLFEFIITHFLNIPIYIKKIVFLYVYTHIYV